MDYLHHHPDFAALLKIIGDEMGILPGLIEKDYWLMHVLFGLKEQGFNFQLKGGTSLSKGYKIIDRFSEDIDIYIKPPENMKVEERASKTKTQHIESRKSFFDWLANQIKIDGIVQVERDTAFDNKTFTSAGIRLYYQNKADVVEGVKPGILLEAGFDTVTPNNPLSISSWALDTALKNPKIKIINNTAIDIPCYAAEYTLVEKLQTLATKFRQEQADGNERANLMRQYYDIARLLSREDVRAFIGTAAYEEHKKQRFPGKDLEIPLHQNEAFLLSDSKLRERFKARYVKTANLYYNGQPPFEELLDTIHKHLLKL